MFFSIYENLCQKNGMSPNAVAKLLSISSGAVTEWKKGRLPQNATLKKIAEFFNVSVDYLLGKEKSPSSEENGLSDTQKEIIALFDAAPPELQAAALAVLKSAERRPQVQDVTQADK